jgi:hypothetical protein
VFVAFVPAQREQKVLKRATNFYMKALFPSGSPTERLDGELEAGGLCVPKTTFAQNQAA